MPKNKYTDTELMAFADGELKGGGAFFTSSNKMPTIPQGGW